MRRIGLLGGMSWESSSEYYKLVNQLVRERLGGLHSADCLMYSVDFAGIAELQAAGRWEEAGDELAAGAKVLEAGGAEFLLLCTNTMHLVADQVQAAVSIPLIHLIDVTAKAIRDAGLTEVGLLATGFTMEGAFYRERMARQRRHRQAARRGRPGDGAPGHLRGAVRRQGPSRVAGRLPGRDREAGR